MYVHHHTSSTHSWCTAEEDRLGLYCNIGTPNKDHKIFGGRYITDLGVYSDAWKLDPKSWEFGSLEYGVRTSLQQAADEHPPQARWLSEVWLFFLWSNFIS